MLTLRGHDGDLGPSRPQCENPSLITGASIDAGGKDVQAHVAVLPQESSQFLGTGMTRGPGDETGEPVVQPLVQIPRTDPVQEVALRMAGHPWFVSTLHRRGRKVDGVGAGRGQSRQVGEALASSAKLARGQASAPSE